MFAYKIVVYEKYRISHLCETPVLADSTFELNSMITVKQFFFENDVIIINL